MAVCERLEKCPFYQGEISMERGVGALYKKRYCEEDKELCARYKIASTLGPEYVSNDFFPNNHEEAERIIARYKR